MVELTLRKWLNILFEGSDAESAQVQKSILLRICQETGNDFNDEMVSILFKMIIRQIKSLRWTFEEILRDLRSIESRSQNARCLIFQLENERLLRLENYKVPLSDRIDQIRTIERSLAVPNPSLAMNRVQLLVSDQKWEEAAAAFRDALNLHPEFSFYLKTQNILSKICREADPSIFKRRIRIGVLGSCTTNFFVSVLKAAGFARGIHLEIYEAPYGNYNQEILNPNSALYSFKPDVVFLLIESHDFTADPIIDEQRAENYIKRILNLQQILHDRLGSHLIFTGLDMPLIHTWNDLEYTESKGRCRQIARINQELASSAGPNISFLSVERLISLCSSAWSNPRDWFTSKQYPSPEGLPILADAVAAQIAAIYGLSKKVLVLDLDNTLWGGIIGEDGIDGIKVGGSSAQGESFYALQRYAKELQQKGTLLAVCSKNNEADALLPFEQHSDMLLKRNDFVSFYANWNDKVSNIKSIASDLNLGLDSFVFIDDNPVERAHVKEMLPEVAVPEFGNQHWKIVPFLQRSMFFESIVLTEEDLKRNENYLRRAKTIQAAKSASNIEDFLRGLNMRCTCLPVDENNISRVVQLLNKSNQFNLTTKRYNLEQVRERIESPHWRCRAFRLSDQYDDHGIVGILFAEIREKELFIDTFVMSCRVIGRSLEDLMLEIAQNEAKTAGISSLLGQYIPTAKNILVKDFYKSKNFTPSSEDEGYWDLDILNSPLPENKIIAIDSTEIPLPCSAVSLP
ncbi:MAG: HAD-IIIC family phosphatase [Planctomycetia bacterium]|nr:HAD-IIIC family phosphatase [Planctomycetia bacterium]